MSTADLNSSCGSAHLRRYTQTEGITVDANLDVDMCSYIKNLVFANIVSWPLYKKYEIQSIFFNQNKLLRDAGRDM